jgi:hypothetical protein
MTETVSGTFLVATSDEAATVLQHVGTAGVHTVDGGDYEAGEVIDEATLEPSDDGVTWNVVETGERRTIPIEHVAVEPTKQAFEAVSEAEVGDLERRERAGEGELHFLRVPPERLDTAARDVTEDPATRRRAARFGVDRVEVRTGARDGVGVVSVRYLP